MSKINWSSMTKNNIQVHFYESLMVPIFFFADMVIL